jgi:hypothetical protein
MYFFYDIQPSWWKNFEMPWEWMKNIPRIKVTERYVVLYCKGILCPICGQGI